MQHKINIEGIKLYAFHGCLEEEARIGANYIVDVYITTDFSKAAVSDDLDQTIDYCAIYEISKKQMALRSKLIEHACKRIFDEIVSEFKTIRALRVKLTKLSPPMNGNVERVSVEMQEDL
jgi:7,8-dihydroneopterin aldolase/epimerase/oxygenase